jgi:hypothetical protein
VQPSGGLPSLLESPTGSIVAGAMAVTSASIMMSLASTWRACRPWLMEQLSACSHLAIWPPQRHMWGTHTGAPGRSPTATLISSSVSFRPRLAFGVVLSHAPALGAVTASSRARSFGVLAVFSRLAAASWLSGLYAFLTHYRGQVRWA